MTDTEREKRKEMRFSVASERVRGTIGTRENETGLLSFWFPGRSMCSARCTRGSRHGSRVTQITVTGAQLFSSLPARRRAPPVPWAQAAPPPPAALQHIIIRRSTEQSETVSKAHPLRGRQSCLEKERCVGTRVQKAPIRGRKLVTVLGGPQSHFQFHCPDRYCLPVLFPGKYSR